MRFHGDANSTDNGIVQFVCYIVVGLAPLHVVKYDEKTKFDCLIKIEYAVITDP
jgi:hypothetical protein